MVRQKQKYTNINVPEDLAKEIDALISKSKMGYDSRAQFAVEAIREKIYKEKKL